MTEEVRREMFKAVIYTDGHVWNNYDAESKSTEQRLVELKLILAGLSELTADAKLAQKHLAKKLLERLDEES